MVRIKNRAVIPVCVSAFFINLLLFITKLYIGLSSNSISIYSDGVNNLFDSFSGLLSAVCLLAVLKSTDLSTRSRTAKTEQFLSFVLSVLVAGAGLVFAYSSVERLIYPTPVWYSVKYMWMLIATAGVKVLMFLLFRFEGKKHSSQVLKLMSVDCVLDFFITSVTVITLVVSDKGIYSFDAICGIFISVIIIVSAVRMLAEQIRGLMNLPSANDREEIEAALKAYGAVSDKSELIFFFNDEKEAFLKTDSIADESAQKQLKSEIFEKTGIEIHIVKI